MRLGDLYRMSDEEIEKSLAQLENEVEKLTLELRQYRKERTRRNDLRRRGHQINRDLMVFNLRESGKPFTEIALEVGVSVSRARQLYLKIERQKRFDTKRGLPDRYE